jgi:hypothetical protein
LVEGEENNIKITKPMDLIAEKSMKETDLFKPLQGRGPVTNLNLVLIINL